MNLRFDWEYFDEEFLHAIAYSDRTPDSKKLEEDTYIKDMLVSVVSDICNVPNQSFVINYRNEIEELFLKKHPRLVYEVFRLPSNSHYLAELEKLAEQPLTTGLATTYLKALTTIGYGNYSDVLSDYVYTFRADLSESIATDKISLYDFQEQAYEGLQNFFLGNNQQRGFLVMPTGSGKTRTTVAWLLEKAIPSGYQIVWLTHRHILIDQAAVAFAENCPVITLENPEKKIFEMVCVSGQHQRMSAIAKSNDVMILSINSVARGREYFQHALKDKVILVIDEAHHAIADSYKNTIEYIFAARPNAKLLGITATPVRVMDREERGLTNLFHNNVAYSISMAELITKGILANPKFKRIMTKENFEKELTETEIKYLRHYKELPGHIEKKIAESKKRNNIIVREYMSHKQKYGKTLIFAMSTVQAVTLVDDLVSEGIKAAYVCYTNGKELNNSIIKRFHKGEIDVLVNVNILTEGTDIPDIKTVFLTRSTTSEALLLQMIGRGMRGIYAGGTKELNVIDFYDEWDIFTKWLNPELVMLPPLPDKKRQKTVRKKKTLAMEWDNILSTYRHFKTTPIVPFSYSKLNLPCGWYDLKDRDGDRYTLLVYSGQLSGYERFKEQAKLLPEADKLTIAYLLENFFGNFVDIKPTANNLQIFWENLIAGEEIVFHSFSKRDKIEPFTIAKEIRTKKLYPESYVEEIYNKYSEASSLYGDEDTYYGAVLEAMKLLKNGMQQPKQYVVEELPLEQLPLKLDEPYDLQELLQEVLEECFSGKDNKVSDISWTDRPMKSYYGMYYFDSDSIQINKLLNSSNVQREAVKYIIYHELLHKQHPNHTKEFREEEHKYPNWAALEHHLDYELFRGYDFSTYK